MTRTEEYHAYIRSSEWKALRKKVIEKAGFSCQKCGAFFFGGNGLDVHHLHYRTLFNERPGDLQALCRECHEKADDERKEDVEREVYDKRLNGWAAKKYGEDWECYCDPQEVEEEFEEWLECKSEQGY